MVRIIEPQTESEIREVSNREAEELLIKYGYHNNTNSSINNDNLTFEEMIKQEEEKKIKNIKRTKPITFNNGNEYYTDTKWSSDEDTGIGFRVDIVSDMKF
jgi:hypothetical protein